MSDAHMKVEGRTLPPFSVWTMFVVVGLPGSEERERVPIKSIFVTDKGEMVFVSAPYPNLVKKRNTNEAQRTRR